MTDILTTATAEVRQGGRASRTAEFRIYYAICLMIFLPVLAIARLIPGTSRPVPGVRGSRRQSILGEAKAAASAVVPFAFMG